MFPNQLEIFYKGVSGYLYCIEKSSNILPIDGSESVYYSESDIIVDNVFFISDIFQELMKYEAMGSFKLFKFNEQSKEYQDKLIDKSSEIIIRSDFFKNDEIKLKFYKKYFTEAWKRAELKYYQKK